MAPDMGNNKNCQNYLTFTTANYGKTTSFDYNNAIKISADNLVFSPFVWNSDFEKEDADIEKYIINENATIIFWDDDTKTISKRDKDDEFDKELGFLYAYFYKKYTGTKASMKRVLNCIDFKNIKTFLFEFYVVDSGKTAEQARKYLKNLEVANN